eukprot:g51366.t1
MLCYAMLCNAMLCYAMLCYAMLGYAMLCHAQGVDPPSSAMLCHSMLCHSMLCYAMLCHAQGVDPPSSAMLCYAILCYAILCYAMLCYAMQCYAMLCYAVLCHAQGVDGEKRVVWPSLQRDAMLCYAMPCSGHGVDGDKRVVVPSFQRELTLLDHDGHILPGYPLLVPGSPYFHAAPVLLDYDGDGIMDYIWISVDAEIFVLNGDVLSGKQLLQVQRKLAKLPVPKDWWKTGQMDMDEGVEAPVYSGRQEMDGRPRRHLQSQGRRRDEDGGARVPPVYKPDPDGRFPERPPGFQPDAERDQRFLDRYAQSLQYAAGYNQGRDRPFPSDQLVHGLTMEGVKSLRLFLDDEQDPMVQPDDVNPAPVQNQPEVQDSKTVHVDAHVMCTPSLIDLTGDGFEDLVIAVSYFFDEDDYNAHPHLYSHLPVDINIRKYVAGAVVAYDLLKDQVIWEQQLDLSVDEGIQRKAYIYSSPTVVDLDGDGGLEVIVGTSMGFIYVFHAYNGELLPGFPIAMAEIQATIAAEDLDGDGEMEMIALDSLGNVLCFDKRGQEKWSSSITGFSSQEPAFGDVDGDGKLDVVVGTLAGTVWALHGQTGKPLTHFPVKTGGRLLSPITLADLSSQLPAPPGLHIIVPCFDGHVYVIDGRTGCADKIDIGERSYTMVLVEDVMGDGFLDLVVTTMNGNVFCFATEAPARPLATWPKQRHGLNVFTAREGHLGIYFDERTRATSHVAGRTVQLGFVIQDRRPAAASRRYSVTIRHGHTLLGIANYTAPGDYQLSIQSLPWARYALLSLEMRNEHMQYYSDTTALGFNVQIYKAWKYLLLLPFMVTCALIALTSALPDLSAPKLPQL